MAKWSSVHYQKIAMRSSHKKIATSSERRLLHFIFSIGYPSVTKIDLKSGSQGVLIGRGILTFTGKLTCEFLSLRDDNPLYTLHYTQ